MGNVTISLEDKKERLLRELAREKYGNKKGSLSKVTGEALKALADSSAKNRAMQRQLKWLERGFDLGKILVKNRDEIYEKS